jgi:YD repeat-containing protein
MALTYDAENRQTAAGPNSYLYDGAGQRVGRTTANGQTIYVYDAFGQLAAEYSTTLPTTLACTTCYLTVDHLGSTRLVVDQSGNVVARHDYAPYGQEIPAGVDGRTSAWGASDNVTQRFTGQERDAETNESGPGECGGGFYESAKLEWLWVCAGESAGVCGSEWRKRDHRFFWRDLEYN